MCENTGASRQVNSQHETCAETALSKNKIEKPYLVTKRADFVRIESKTVLLKLKVVSVVHAELHELHTAPRNQRRALTAVKLSGLQQNRNFMTCPLEIDWPLTGGNECQSNGRLI